MAWRAGRSKSYVPGGPARTLARVAGASSAAAPTLRSWRTRLDGGGSQPATRTRPFPGGGGCVAGVGVGEAAVTVAVPVAGRVAVATAVAVGVGLNVGAGVSVGVGVGVEVAVGIAEAVGVGWGVAVGVGWGVAVGVWVLVGRGEGVGSLNRKFARASRLLGEHEALTRMVTMEPGVPVTVNAPESAPLRPIETLPLTPGPLTAIPRQTPNQPCPVSVPLTEGASPEDGSSSTVGPTWAKAGPDPADATSTTAARAGAKSSDRFIQAPPFELPPSLLQAVARPPALVASLRRRPCSERRAWRLPPTRPVSAR